MKHILFILYIIFALYDTISKENVLALILEGMFIWCYVKILCTHPGPIPNEGPQQGPEKLKIICKICDSWKPPKARHCRHSCNKCIFLYDHHCVWLDQCIGYKNLKYFCLFLLYLLLQSIVSIIPHLILFSKYFEYDQVINTIRNQNITNNMKQSFYEVFYIFIYTTALRTSYDLLGDKVDHILYGNTYIDQLQAQFPYYKFKSENFYRQFGHTKWKWFVPLENEFDYKYLECLYPVWTNDDMCLDSNLKNCHQFKVY